MKLRVGELTALLGIGCTIAAMVAPWYESPAGNLDLWDTFGPAAVLLLAALSAAAAMVLAALLERESPALPVSTAVWCVLLGLVGTIAALVRVLERPQHASGLCGGAWLGLAGGVLVLLGALLTLRDERSSRYPPARPAPRPRP
jgi:drug/metabolite transporter (DMT)-like permease